MGAVEERLSALGHAVPDVAPPVAVYVPAVQTGNLVHTSGQLPLVAGVLMGTGKVGADVTPEQATAMAAQCALNAIAAIRALIGDLERVVRVVKVVGFVASDPGFTLPSTITISFFSVGLAKVARSAVRWSPRCVA